MLRSPLPRGRHQRPACPPAAFSRSCVFGGGEPDRARKKHGNKDAVVVGRSVDWQRTPSTSNAYLPSRPSMIHQLPLPDRLYPTLFGFMR